MAFPDPISVVMGGNTLPLPRTGFNDTTGTFSDGETVKVTFSHTSGKRNRHTARFDWTIDAIDPINPTLHMPASMSAYLTVDAPKVGFSAGDQESLVQALCEFLTISSGANAVKLLGGQS